MGDGYTEFHIKMYKIIYESKHEGDIKIDRSEK
jgi:hypothetical protein